MADYSPIAQQTHTRAARTFERLRPCTRVPSEQSRRELYEELFWAMGCLHYLRELLQFILANIEQNFFDHV